MVFDREVDGLFSEASPRRRTGGSCSTNIACHIIAGINSEALNEGALIWCKLLLGRDAANLVCPRYDKEEVHPSLLMAAVNSKTDSPTIGGTRQADRLFQDVRILEILLNGSGSIVVAFLTDFSWLTI